MLRSSPSPLLRGLSRAALVLATATCAPPLQSGGVVLSEGAADRLQAMCRWRGDAATGDLCPAGAPTAAPARVVRLGDDPRARLAGPLAIARAGDYLIENDQIAVVIDQLGPGIGFAESGGNLVDAADARVRRDELGQLFTYFGVFPRQALYEHLSTGAEADGSAWIEVRGRELWEPALSITTRYTLRPGDRAILIATALENTGREPIAGLELGDAVQWGSAEKVAPGKEPGFRGDYEGPYVAGVGSAVAYALIPVEDAAITAKNGTAWSNVSFARGVALPPGGRAQYARVLAIAPRGDPLGIATEALVLGGGAPGGLAIELLDARGAPLKPIDGRVTLTPLNAQGAPLPSDPALWLRASAGPAGGEAPPGRYVLGFEGSGRRALSPAAVEIRAGEVTTARLSLSEAGRLSLSIRELAHGSAGGPSPAKISLMDAATGKPVSPPALTTSGALDLPLAPGRYRVIASRGPEFSIAEAIADVRASEGARVELTLARVVDTGGYLGCDLHQHTALSADSGVALADRVISNVVEGVECAVASEHNVIADLTPTVRALKLEPRFRSIGGEEITDDASREPFGHLNVFPLEPDPKAARGGALRVRDRAAREVIDEILAMPGERVIQVNHPRSGRNGYFDQLGFDPATAAGKTPGYDGRFDAVEVWSGRYVQNRARVLEDIWALLRAGRPVTPTASTDTHGIAGAEAGYPRTYVAVGTDDPAELAPAALVEAIRRRRDVVLTNGPFLTLHAGSARQGGIVSLSAGLALTVRVERAPWVDASELTLIVGGAPAATIPLPGAATTPAGAVLDEVRIPLSPARPAAFRSTLGGSARASRAAPPDPRRPAGGPPPIRIGEDTFVVAIVRGKRPLEPVLAGAPDEIMPFAMTAPLWIDADGDGRALGR